MIEATGLPIYSIGDSKIEMIFNNSPPENTEPTEKNLTRSLLFKIRVAPCISWTTNDYFQPSWFILEIQVSYVLTLFPNWIFGLAAWTAK